MSQVKIVLQAPPNAEFVTGYPGIPPAPDRPQAAVKGTIEVRVPSTGVKAKWVRIELRKVETLPGGGADNVFQDFVGTSPVNLWTSPDEYTILRSQDFPFLIRIPESIPPSIALENRAGISYELVASICTKGKKGFLRKAKSTVSTALETVLIDKHELHSTWPVYCQTEQRQLAQEGVNLTVERNRTCFGPGDIIAAIVTVKSDSLHTIILRGLEMSLRETTVFTPGTTGNQSRKSAPQTIIRNISETKIVVNGTLYGGSSHTSDMSFALPDNHTTTTLNAARHIDVTYALVIKAVMGTGSPLTLELPVIISNWQRPISQEAMNRIGAAPGLSILSASPPPPTTITRLDPGRRPIEPSAPTAATSTPAAAIIAAATLPTNSPYQNKSGINAFSTVAGAGGASAAASRVDEFGGRSTGASATTPASTGAGAGSSVTRQLSGQGQSGRGQWPSAGEEKIRLYEDARQRVVETQGSSVAPPPASITSLDPGPGTLSSSSTRSPPTKTTPIPSTTSSTPAPQQHGGWLTAEEEKLRLFNKATAAAALTQGISYTTPPATASPSAHVRQLSDPKTQGGSSNGPSLYAGGVPSPARNAASGSSGSGSSAPVAKPSATPYLTAEQEKAALKRYHEARTAVQRTQGTTFADDAPPPAAPAPEPASSQPVSYESLYGKPATTTAAPVVQSPPPSKSPAVDEPPPFDSGSSGAPMNAYAQLSEKERLRREYERRDQLAASRTNGAAASPPPPAAYTPAPAPAPAPVPTPAPAPYTAPPPNVPPGPYANAYEEKEAMRRKFEARDQALAARAAQIKVAPLGTTASGPPPPTPPRGNSGDNSPGSRSPNNGSFRPTPPLPPAASSTPARVLTAAEEKAMLRAKYEAQDGPRKPTTPTPQTNGAAPAPPPARVVDNSRLMADDGHRYNGDGGPSSVPELDPIKPFTPFRAGFDSSHNSMASRKNSER